MSHGEITRRAVGRASVGKPSRGLVRQTKQEVDRIAGRAVELAAKGEAAAYVAHVGMQHTWALTREEIEYSVQCPERAYRFRAIADAYAGLVVRNLSEMGYE